ncbi:MULTISPECIES: peptidoglycan D,D-transpeptidase FtsI family protein [Streptomyces]|uniref:Cell division protein FtsI (Penicillin-binding protein 3) n=2 Tax=Streptomyces harbinensis TaxID=1176198 RepID=A0A1I6RUW5_9ACTN|nr:MULTISPECIES: penicillin-binding protein 2 [Streptomyces]QKV68362.1 penicillin-binding protein 2 [Streptomyces harbinensis]SFS68519.1 cell division protein FtsI (penicillin-binding protein 3) [Streptomyces harbinensis]
MSGSDRARGGGTRPPAPRRPRTPGTRRGGHPRPAAVRPRLRLVGLGLALVLVAFTVRLVQVQAVDAATYTEKAAVNRYVEVPLAAQRGDITDRNGTALATTVDAYDITADPFLFTEEQTGVPDAPQQAAALLAPILDRDEATLAGLLSEPGSRYAVLARQQTPQTWRQIKDLRNNLREAADKGTGDQVLSGVFAEKNAKRVYPGGDLAAATLGFVNAEGVGGGGVEAQFNTLLAGEDGTITYAQSGGRRVPTAGSHELPAVPGTDIALTLDRDIQWAAQNAISAQVAASKADDGYVVVMDTTTGEILALAGAPGYDPNDLGSVTDSGLLRNAALQDAFEPGSTLKVATMAAVLEEGVAGPGTHVTVPNRLPRADRNFADDHDHETYYLTLAGVLAKSSNIGTILAAEELGDTQPEANEVLHAYLTRFGFGRPTGLGFPGETAGILAAPGDWNSAQQYTIPFGQGMSVNAVQAASVYATVANGGERIAPTLIRGYTGPDGSFEPAPEAERERVISEETAAQLAEILETVVTSPEGTGSAAQIPGYRVAGKTGTSNRVDPETGRYSGYTASFAGFAPADDPRIAVYCAVQNPTEGSYNGSKVCGPVFNEVMDFSLKALQVPPTGSDFPGLPVTFDPND